MQTSSMLERLIIPTIHWAESYEKLRNVKSPYLEPSFETEVEAAEPVISF